MTKAERQAKILKIIGEKEIENQEELINELQKEGIIVTQATISRDIKELKLVKILSADGKKYKYTTRENGGTYVLDKFLKILSKSIIDITYAGNIVVVKTLSGAASAAGEAIDGLKWEEIVGTVAGNNTIFILTKNEKTAKDIVEKLRKLISSPDTRSTTIRK